MLLKGSLWHAHTTLLEMFEFIRYSVFSCCCCSRQFTLLVIGEGAFLLKISLVCVPQLRANRESSLMQYFKTSKAGQLSAYSLVACLYFKPPYVMSILVDSLGESWRWPCVATLRMSGTIETSHCFYLKIQHKSIYILALIIYTAQRYCLKMK